MKIPADVAQIRYLLAHVRLHAASDPSTWKLEAVLDAFYLLAPPVVPFDDWCNARGLEIASLQDENAAALATLKGMMPDAKEK